MKMTINNIILFVPILFIAACGGSQQDSEHHEHDHGHGHGDEVHFTEEQFHSLQIKVDTLPKRNMSSYIEVNGQLEVPPQSEAEVTAIIGANVRSIEVIEGDKVKKGQVLAYLAHPDLIQIQSDYIANWNELQFLRREFDRQEKLYEEKVGSGKEFQKIKFDYNAMIGKVKALEAQLNLLGLSADRLQNSKISETIAVRSPINGFIRFVEIKIGQFVSPEKTMFEIVNVDHIHADLMVFEKDVYKVKEGQQVQFTVESSPGKEFRANIYAVGRAFEQDPKAVHLHAEIENKGGLLVPGMYVRGKILIDDMESYAVPEEGIVRHEDKNYIFSAEKTKDHHGETEWLFKPIEVVSGKRDNGWVEVKLLNPLDEGTKIVWNNAYNLMADLKKEEAEHSH